jgi:hypothetical protein
MDTSRILVVISSITVVEFAIVNIWSYYNRRQLFTFVDVEIARAASLTLSVLLSVMNSSYAYDEGTHFTLSRIL